MKRRILSVLLCVCMALTMMPAATLTAWATGPVSYLDWDEAGRAATEVKSCTEYSAVESSADAVTWGDGWYVVTGSVTISQRIQVNGNASLILTDGAHLTASRGIEVTGSKSLAIYGQSNDENTMGSLTATGGTDPIGQTGISVTSGNSLTINGGNIEANGTSRAAGIGGQGWSSPAGNITINGGIVTARGSSGGSSTVYSGAGIGGCGDSSQSNTAVITINGGTITATGGSYAPGIGGGGYETSSGNSMDGGTIVITGGTVTATGGGSGAGIGSGKKGTAGDITISGGTVIATGGYGSAGIGCGNQANGGTIRLSGQDTSITATAGTASTGSSQNGISYKSTIYVNGSPIDAHLLVGRFQKFRNGTLINYAGSLSAGLSITAENHKYHEGYMAGAGEVIWRPSAIRLNGTVTDEPAEEAIGVAGGTLAFNDAEPDFTGSNRIDIAIDNPATITYAGHTFVVDTGSYGINLDLQGTSSLTAASGPAINSVKEITVTGSGILTVTGSNSDGSDRPGISAVGLSVNEGATLNAIVEIISGSAVTNNTVCGEVAVQSSFRPTGDLVISRGATLTIPADATLDLSNHSVNAIGQLVNNGTILLPEDADPEEIRELPLSGTGAVRVVKEYNADGEPAAWDTYTNDGLLVISGSLDLTGGDHSGKTVADDGYSWDSENKILTLGNVSVTGSVILPDGAAVYTISDSAVGDRIIGAASLNVMEAGTTLNVSSSGIYAVSCDTVNVGNGAFLNVSAEGAGSMGIKTSGGGVNVTGGSTLTAGCDYGIYIIGGKLTVDSSSTLITDASTAPFCVMDTTSSKSQGQVVSLPGIPSGTAIASVIGTDSGYGYTYWSLVPAGGTLSVSNEDVTPAALTGAAGGQQLTFVRPESTGGSSGGGSRSTSALTVSVSSKEGSVKVSVNVNGSTATISVTDEQFKEIASAADTAGTIKIDVSSLKVDAVVIPEKIITAVREASGAAGLELALPGGSVTLDKAALAAVAGKGDVKLSVETVANDKLTDAQKAVLGTQVGSAVVVDVNIDVNGIKTGTFDGGKLAISVPYTLKQGDNADSITVWFIKDDGTIEPKNGVYNAATGRVEFTTDHLSQYLIVKFPFADVAEKAWYYESVAYAWNNGLFSGTSETSFTPGTAMTRQMIWMVLARMDGKAPANMTEAKAWAVENKISDGSNPKNEITRGQMAAILYRYAQYKNYDTTQGGMAIREFADYDSIPAYAMDALGWTVNTGLLQGSSDKLMPKGSATRAQVAAILQRFNQNAAK